MALIDDVSVPLHAWVAIGLFATWAITEGAIHLAGIFQPEDQPRQRAGLTWLQTAYAGGLIAGLLDSTWLRWTTLSGDDWPVFVGAALLVTMSLVLRLTARLQLGKNFSAFVQTCDQHRMISNGVYRVVRHPAYTGFLGFLIGFPLCFGSLMSLAVSLLIGLPAIVYRIQAEERALVEWFGDDYRNYQRRTKRLLPFIW